MVEECLFFQAKIKKLRIIVSNYIIGQFHEGFGEVIFYSGLELRTIKIDSFSSFLSFISALLAITAGVMICIVHWKLLRKYQKIKESASEREQSLQIKKFNKMYESLEILFGDFKDTSLSTQGYLLILTGRNIIFNLIIVFLTTVPVAQVFVIVIMHFIILGYFAIKKPLKSYVNLAQQTSLELALLTINLSWLGMTIVDTKDNFQSTTRDNLSDVVMMVNLIYTFIPIVFLVLKLFEAGKEFKEFLMSHRQRARITGKNSMPKKGLINSRLKNLKKKQLRKVEIKQTIEEHDCSIQVLQKSSFVED